MKQVSAAEFQKRSGTYHDMALSEPITITKHDRPSWVLLSFEDYQTLTGNTKRALHVSELSKEAAETLKTAKMDEKYNHLNDLLED